MKTQADTFSAELDAVEFLYIQDSSSACECNAKQVIETWAIDKRSITILFLSFSLYLIPISIPFVLMPMFQSPYCGLQAPYLFAPDTGILTFCWTEKAHSHLKAFTFAIPSAWIAFPLHLHMTPFISFTALSKHHHDSVYNSTPLNHSLSSFYLLDLLTFLHTTWLYIYMCVCACD